MLASTRWLAMKRKRYTEQERARILSAAASEELTGKQASAKFGVSQATLWKWRRDAKGVKMKRQPRALQQGPSNGSLASMIRTEVQARVRELVSTIIREEVAQAFGSKRRM